MESVDDCVPYFRSDIPELNVRLGLWWRLIDDADSGRRRLTLFPHVAP